MRRRTFAFGLLLLGIASLPISTSAHGGGLDKNGCHHNRKTGDYHCHRGSSAATTTCDAQATEKKLSGTARTSFTKKCVSDATGAAK